MYIIFLPTPPPRGAWVFRWTFFPLPPLPPLPLPLPPLPHLQSFVSLRYRTFLLGTENAGGGGVGLWQCMPSCLKTIQFCNKGVVWADPPPRCGQRPHFYIFFVGLLVCAWTTFRSCFQHMKAENIIRECSEHLLSGGFPPTDSTSCNRLQHQL